jgi:hypothetical protein
MKKVIFAALVLGAIAGGFFLFRWFRGESDYEQAVQELDEGPALEPHMNADAAPPIAVSARSPGG